MQRLSLVRLWLAAGIAASCACTLTRPGTLRALPEGPAMEALVSLEGESAFVTATDPGTGEVLKGRLVGESERPAGPPPMDPFAGSAVTPGPAGPSGASLKSAGPRTLRLVGALVGDRGTTLHCEVALEQRIRVRGQGLCTSAQQGSELRYILVF